MKIFKTLMLFIMIGLLITSTGCSSNDDGGDGGNAGEGTMTAKVDGNTVTSIELASQATLVPSTNTLILQGTDANGKGFVITINGYNGTGTYDIGGSSLSIALYIEADASNPANTQTWQAPFDANVNGSVSVSEETSDNVKGTFEFTGQNANDNSQKVISEGSFNLGKQTT